MAYAYKNQREYSNAAPGIAEYALLAPKSWFAPGGLKYPTGPFGVTSGDQITIKEAHVFNVGKGFIYFVLAPQKNEINTITVGDPGFNKENTEVKLIFPGSTPAQHEQLRNLLNTPLVGIFKDANCGANMYYQLGTDCAAGYLTSNFKSGTTASGIKGFEATFKYEDGPLFYDVVGGPEILVD
jgi:hypothetical protein